MKRNLLLSPGPSKVPPELCEVLGRPVIHHRTPQFQSVLKEVFEGLKKVLKTQNDVFIFASSGTGAMEAAVCNLLSAGDKAITVEAGKFGERWTELCKAYGAVPKVLQITWGKSVMASAIKEILDADKEIKAVFITLCETSTATMPDVKSIADVVKNTNAVLVVDAISGLGPDELKADEWGVDIVCSACHKGLMLPPGVSFVSVSPKAMKLAEQSKSPKYYFDFKKCKKAVEKTDTPFTPSISLVIALNESLKMINAKGIENSWGYYAKMAKAVRAAAKALKLNLLADESCASNAVTAIFVPEGIDGEKLVKTLRDVHGITMAGGQGDLKGKIIRIAHMGAVDEYDILTGLSSIEKVLLQMGYKFELGVGVAAAQKVLNS
ncbi:MAG: alanine--glyoxylate aminotransferase family protein [Candidatus Omnitrophica bacterium]|nr:alanine--glyoxylate aminotransferase family protein [Candidatus Omnitrophota bacterium]